MTDPARSSARPGTVGPLRGNFFLHGAVLLFGLAGLFGKWVLLHPILIVFARVLVASAAFAVFSRFLTSPGNRPAPGERLVLLATGGLLAFHWFAFFQSIQVSTVAIGLVAYSTAPVFAALLEPLWFPEPFSRRALACAALGMGGVALIVPYDAAGSAEAGVVWGVVWGVLAGLSFAALSLVNRRLVRTLSSIRVAFFQDAVAMVLLAPLLPLVWRTPTWEEAGLLVILGVVCTALAHTLFIQSLKAVTARFAAIASTLEPVYGIALAWALLGEVPALRTVLGGAVVLSAVLWASLRRRMA